MLPIVRKAIAIWKKINKLDATALDPYLLLADLYAKQGLMMEAKSQYQIVVDEYVKPGKGREAGEVLRKMADIDPACLSSAGGRCRSTGNSRLTGNC